MKLPNIFVPNKNLEKNVEELLLGIPKVPKNHNINFDSLEIEPGMISWHSNKKYITNFEKSLERLRKAGYERHLYPWESFELIMNHFEGKLNETLDAITKNLRASDGEWFNLAVERQGEKLVCYVDPENIRWDGYDEKYVVDGVLRYSYKEDLKIRRISSQMWTSMQYFEEDFAEFFCNRKFKDIPQKLQEHTMIYLPPDYELWPIGRGSGGAINICGYVSDRASRGVRAKK